MSHGIGHELAILGAMNVDQLRTRYRQVFGQEIRSRHRQHLIRMIAWRMQVLREGDLSGHARRRAAELVADARPLRLSALPPSAGTTDSNPPAPGNRANSRNHAGRQPPPGTVISRPYKGRTILVHVLHKGFQWEGQTFKSLTAVAKAVTGTHWNGYHFFGLRKN